MKKAKIILVALSVMLLLTGVVSYADTVNSAVKSVPPEGFEKAIMITEPFAGGISHFGFGAEKRISVNRVNLEDYKGLSISEKKEKLLAEFKTALEKWDGEEALIFEASTLDKILMEKFDGAAKDIMIGMAGELAGEDLANMKEKLLKSVTENINEQVKANIITKEEGDKRIADLKSQLEKWDGKGPFSIKLGEGDMLFFKHSTDKK